MRDSFGLFLFLFHFSGGAATGYEPNFHISRSNGSRTGRRAFADGDFDADKCKRTATDPARADSLRSARQGADGNSAAMERVEQRRLHFRAAEFARAV